MSQYYVVPNIYEDMSNQSQGYFAFRFRCQDCGTKLPMPDLFCPKCSTRLDNNPRFCSECGTKLQQVT